MKNLFFLILISLLLLSCKQIIRCEIYGYILYQDNTPIKDVEIGYIIEVEPNHYEFFPDTEVQINKNGRFILIVEKHKTKHDKQCEIYFRKKGFEDVVKMMDLTINKSINLDTIYLKPFLPLEK